MEKRVFFSIPLSMGVRNKIKNILSRYNFPGKIEPEEKWHITLNFVGSVDDNELAQLVFIGKEAASSTEVFDIKIKDLIYVPSFEHPRMLWAKIENNKKLDNLKKFIDNKIFSSGIPYRVDFSIYNPHINLARFVSEDLAALPKKLDQGIGLEMAVDEFNLMESRSERHKVRYEILAKYNLNFK